MAGGTRASDASSTSVLTGRAQLLNRKVPRVSESLELTCNGRTPSELCSWRQVRSAIRSAIPSTPRAEQLLVVPPRANPLAVCGLHFLATMKGLGELRRHGDDAM
jgi:hypothetical protein